MKVEEKKGFTDKNDGPGEYKAMRRNEGEGKEYSQETLGGEMSKGPKEQGTGGEDGNNFALGKRGGKEFAVEEAKYEGMCK